MSHTLTSLARAAELPKTNTSISCFALFVKVRCSLRQGALPRLSAAIAPH